METRPSTHIAGLDLIRLAAAMFVVFDHFTAHKRNEWVIHAIGGGLPSFPALSPITDAGWIGVDIFFVISGLVIAYTANGNSPRRFAESRFFRLMPSVWIISTVSAIILMFASSVEWHRIFTSYLQSIVLSPVGQWVDGSYWSLCVEIVFYALIFAILCKNKFSEIDRLLGFAGVVVSILAVVNFMFSSRYPLLAAVFGSWPAKVFLLNNGTEFVFGVFLYLVLFIGANSFRLGVLAICFLGCCTHITFDIYAVSAIISKVPGGNAGIVESGFAFWAPLILWLAAVLAMIISVRFNALITNRFWYAMPTIRQMGLLTYPLYLIHSPLGLVVLQRVYKATHSSTLALIAAIIVVLLAAAAVLMIEPALRAMIKSPVRRGVDFVQGLFFGARLAEPTSKVE